MNIGPRTSDILLTQGLVLEVRVHGAEIQDLKWTSSSYWTRMRAIVFPSASRTCGWTPLYTGQEDKRAGWVERMLGWTAEIVRHPKKLAPEEVMRTWVRELNKEGVPIDLDKLLAGKGPRPFLPKRWIVERTFSLGSLRTRG